MYSLFICAINSIRMTLSVFVSSTSTAYILSKMANVPFVNPSFTINKTYSNLRFIMGNVYTVVSTTTLPLITVLYMAVLDESKHSVCKMGANLISYAVLIEFSYYIYHRTQHSILFLKKIHNKHHENINVYPFDTFYIDYFDAIGLSVCLLYPSTIVYVNSSELFLILYFYATGAYIEHSNILTRHHIIHHRRFNCNYSFIFPVFDILFGSHTGN